MSIILMYLTFTESNETFVMLLLTSNANDDKKMMEIKDKLTRKDTKPKYTKDLNVSRRFRGW